MAVSLENTLFVSPYPLNKKKKENKINDQLVSLLLYKASFRCPPIVIEFAPLLLLLCIVETKKTLYVPLFIIVLHTYLESILKQSRNVCSRTRAVRCLR